MKNVIALASDHAAVDLKSAMIAEIESMGLKALDLGTNNTASVDYPDFAHALAHAILSGQAERGVLMCGSGVGMSISVNRHEGIRGALVSEPLSAKLSRQHNNANVLVMGARIIGIEMAKECLRTFLRTEFEGGRHAARVTKIEKPTN